MTVTYSITVTDRAAEDLASLPEHIEETFYTKRRSILHALNDLGATPGQAFDKYLSGPMHPVLQLNLGRDHRAWFLEGRFVPGRDDTTILCWRVLGKNEAQELTGQISDPVAFVRRSL